jgi:hypothetical protein
MNEYVKGLEKENLKLKQLLRRFYVSAHELDLEYCTIVNNYDLKPVFTRKEYQIPKEYDDIWMETFEEVEKCLGIE